MDKLKLSFTGRRRTKTETTSTESFSSSYLQSVLERLRCQDNRASTRHSYHKIWTKFNEFLIKLDVIPEKWENKVALYCAYLIEIKELQSSTIRTYVSAIKKTLSNDGYEWNDKLLLLSAITRACKLKNDTLHNRLPIQKGLLSIVLSQLEIKFKHQWYLECLYKVAFPLAYHGLFRVGELTASQHVLKTRDVHHERNKEKYLFLLHTSKTHTFKDRPQTIEIKKVQLSSNKLKMFCPYRLVNLYISIRGKRTHDSEQFLLHSDGSPLLTIQFRDTLKQIIADLGLDPNNYDTHSFRIGRATDLMREGKSIESIKRQGRWKSNAVYKYLR